MISIVITSKPLHLYISKTPKKYRKNDLYFCSKSSNDCPICIMCKSLKMSNIQWRFWWFDTLRNTYNYYAIHW